MTALHFATTDVFTDRAYAGNPLAIVEGADRPQRRLRRRGDHGDPHRGFRPAGHGRSYHTAGRMNAWPRR